MQFNPIQEQRKIAKKYKIGYYSDNNNFENSLQTSLTSLDTQVELINLQDLTPDTLKLYSTVLDEVIIDSNSIPENLIDFLKNSKPFSRLISINIEGNIKEALIGVEFEKLDKLDFDILSSRIQERYKLILELKKLKVSSKETNLKFIMQLVSILENKDPYTKDHSARVAKYSEIIAKSYFPEHFDELYSNKNIENSEQYEQNKHEYVVEKTNLCMLTAWAHDIGKTSIGANLLNKDSKLTNSEYNIIKMHADFGAEMIRKILGDEEFAEIIENHHERIDGQGYHHLEEFPDISKIIAIADSFDAMTTTRPYTTKTENANNKNKLKTLEEAIMELQICSHLHMDLENSKMSHQLDTTMTDIFVQILKRELNLLKEGKLDEVQLFKEGLDENGYIKAGYWNDRTQLYNQDKNVSDYYPKFMK